MTNLLGRVKSLAHPLINVWQEDDGVIIFEVASIWRFHDDSEIKVNACSIFTLVDGKFTDQRIYVDNAPSTPSSASEGPNDSPYDIDRTARRPCRQRPPPQRSRTARTPRQEFRRSLENERLRDTGLSR